MSEDRIRDCVEAFVEELSGLVRQAALESVREALGAPAPKASKPSRSRAAAAAAPAAAAPAPAKKRRAKKAGKRIRRSPEDMANIQAKLIAFVKQNPGQRIEQIAPALGMSSKELARPTKLLIDGRKLKTKGQKRSTTYFVK